MLSKNLDILKEFAKQTNLDYRLLYAILMNESNADGFYKNGKIKSRFEPHIYRGFEGVKDHSRTKHPSLPGLKTDWIRHHHYHQLKLLSTSYGMAQIMGWHYPMLNYTTVEMMIDEYTAAEELQVRSFCLFCVKYRSGKFMKELEAKNIQNISSMYNGAGYKKNKYDEKLLKNTYVI